MKKVFTLLLTILIVSNSMAVSFAETDKEPILAAEAAVLIDTSTGEVLYNKNMDRKMYPASITKIMTALLVLENLDLSSIVTIDKETSLTEGSRIHLSEGEKVTVEQLLYALLLKSANDAAVALAKEVAGSAPEFAKMMNARAEELGAKNTNFVTPNGLHDDNHYTTAYDLAMIAKAAMKNSEFRKAVTTLKYTIPKTNKNNARELLNPNKLLYGKSEVPVNGVLKTSKYEGSTGIKTGYTSEAGRCLVAGAKRGNVELISVVLKSTDLGSFGDSIALLDYGFENYKSISAIKKGDYLGKIKVIRGSVRKVDIVAAKSSYLTIPIEKAEPTVNTKVVIDKKIQAPVSKGHKVGKVEIYRGNILVDEVDAVTSEKVDKGGLLSAIGISDSVSYILKIFSLIVIALLTILTFRRKKIKRKKY